MSKKKKIDYSKQQLHAGTYISSDGSAKGLYHTNSKGLYWSGCIGDRTREALLNECISTIRDLLKNHPELNKNNETFAQFYEHAHGKPPMSRAAYKQLRIKALKLSTENRFVQEKIDKYRRYADHRAASEIAWMAAKAEVPCRRTKKDVK